MAALPQPAFTTEADYLAYERESDAKHEFINGEIVAMSGASVAHIRISVNIVNLISRQSTCEVFNADMRVKITATTSYTYPDASAVCGQPAFMSDEPAATLLNPTVIIEVLSPSTARYDRTTKFDQYQQIPTLQDDVLIYQSQPQVDVYSRAENDTWLLTRVQGLGSTVTIPAVGQTLSLQDIYTRVAFE